MNHKERMDAVMGGRPTDRRTVTTPYSHLYMIDRFAELTGLPQWHVLKWLHDTPENHLALYDKIREQLPFDIVQPLWGAQSETRENTEFVEHNAVMCMHDRRTEDYIPVSSLSATTTHANETQTIFTVEEALEVNIRPAEDFSAKGDTDYMQVVTEKYRNDHFVLTAGINAPFYSCHAYVGLTNLYALTLDNPELVDTLCKKILEQNIELVRAYAALGGSAIFIDDATATSDMISVQHYERFSMPYLTEMVREIHRFGQKAILIYFGGIADRLQQIASTGADAIVMETSMKGYVNDVGQVAETIGDRMVLFGNLDPSRDLELSSISELRKSIAAQVDAARSAKGFIVSTGSPITPDTPVQRVQEFIKIGRSF